MDNAPKVWLPQTSWHPQLDNPDVIGWSVVAAYGLAAAACAWVAWKTGKTNGDNSKIWWLMAAVLFFLGVNKQLNLQTLMIVLGRQAALAGGWYGNRRFVQGIFCIVFAALGLCLLGFFATQARRFIERNLLAFAGIIVLTLFVLLRASTINHADTYFGLSLKAEHWGWLLELTGSALIIKAAVTAGKSAKA
jgi:hypothetical protein